MIPVLTAEQMRAAEQRCFAAGTASLALMEQAGAAVAETIRARFAPCPVAILCGPGNNGGDGWVIARHLQAAGFDVRPFSLVPREALQGDAATMARQWTSNDDMLRADIFAELSTMPLWVDALFGIGLSRALPEIIQQLGHARALASEYPKIIAVDVPSGLLADRADTAYAVWPADITVTFGALKQCHVFQPARDMCGDIILADIGIGNFIKTSVYVQNAEDGRQVLASRLSPRHDHKYDRGALYVASGPRHQTGAARLAARAGLRAGAGVVTLLAPAEAMDIIAGHETAIMMKPVESASDFVAAVMAKQKTAAVIGPAFGVGQKCREFVRALLQTNRPMVLDADALTSFAGEPESLFELCHDQVVMTPHKGEFAALFADIASAENPLAAAGAAAVRSQSVVCLKGAQTVIAHPDGRIRINDHASPWLATAGSGDVLAGMMGAFLAQGWPAFDAACAAAWLHGDCARRYGPGLIAEDLPDLIPVALSQLI